MDKKVGDKHGEGKAYGNLGNVYHSLGDFKKAIEYHNLHLDIAKEIGNKHGEGNASGNLGIAYDSLGDFKKAIEYHNLNLKIAKEVRDKHGEGKAFGNLGIAYDKLGDFKKAIEYHNCSVAKSLIVTEQTPIYKKSFYTQISQIQHIQNVLRLSSQACNMRGYPDITTTYILK